MGYGCVSYAKNLSPIRYAYVNLMEVGCSLDLRLDYRLLFKLGVISQERLKIEVKLLLNVHMKSY